jgi:hypothetical protein
MSISLFTLGIFSIFALFSSIFVSMTYAQIFPGPFTPTSTNSTNLTPSSSHPILKQQQKQIQPVPHYVKIVSPTKGQQLPVGNVLIISGTSADNTTSGCKVSVIVNGVKPYRTAFADGHARYKDYSKWNYTLTPAYTSIKQGQNKITAKFSCANDPTLIAHSSVNVTGIRTSLSPIANHQGQQNAGKNSTTTNVNTTTSNAISPVTSSSPPSITETNNTNKNGTMSVSIHLAKSVHLGDNQSVIIKVTDINSSIPVVGGSISGIVEGPSNGSLKKFEGTTDDTGRSSYSWTLSQNNTTGKYKIIIEVSAYGYKNSTGTEMFMVSPTSVTTTTGSTNNNLIPQPSPNANNSKDNPQSHPSSIIQIPQIRIPTIRAPFHLPFQ